MALKTIIFIIIIFILIIIIFRKTIFRYLGDVCNEYMYPIKKLRIKSDLTNVNSMRDAIDGEIDAFLEGEEMGDKLYFIISEALTGGKRLRPIITLSTYRQLIGSDISNISDDKYGAVVKIAIMIEMIHCTSLVIDDIMDKDVKRRDQPTIHAKYGETYALLASLYMMTLAIQLLIKSIEKSDIKKGHILLLLNLTSAKLKELSVGQYLDIELPQSTVYNQTIDDSLLVDMIHKKTSSLFEICFFTSWIFANDKQKDISDDEITNVCNLARTFGLIYQVADDFEDVQQDLRRNGINYVTNNDPHKAKQEYHELVNKFETDATKLNMYSTELKEIIGYLNEKVNVYYKYIKNIFPNTDDNEGWKTNILL